MNKPSTTFYRAIALATTLIVGGCESSEGLITSLEDVSTEAKKEGWKKVPQYRVVSVPGLLPFADVGGLSFYKPKRKPASVVGLSANGHSYVSITEIKSDCDASCLTGIRDSLVELNTQVVNLVEAKLEVRRLTALETVESATQEDVKAARSNYQALKSRFDSSAEAVSKKLTQEGVMVYRWTTSSKSDGSFKLGNLFGASRNKEEKYGGFALVSNLRMATLFVAPDLLCAWPALDKETRFENRFQLTTHVMQARHILYSAEAELTALMKIKLDGSYEEFRNISKTLREIDQVEIGAAIARAQSVSNMGMIGGASRTTVPVDWGMIANGDIEKVDGWHTFYAVESYLGDLLVMIRPPSSAAPRECQEENRRRAERS